MNQKSIAKLAKLTNMIHTLAIIQEGYIKEAEAILRREGAYRYEYKQEVEIIKKRTENLRRAIYREDPEHAEEYGDDADKIEEIIEKLLEGMKQFNNF